MTTKEYLLQIHRLDARINILIEERDALLSRAMCNQSPQLSADKVQASGSGDAMASAVERYVDIEKKLDEAQDIYEGIRYKIVQQISDLPDSRYSQLLYLHYVKWKRLEDIACIMRKPNGNMYSYIHIKRMHGWALQSFSRKYPNVAEMIPKHVLSSKVLK